jgi:hypothetical protein
MTLTEAQQNANQILDAERTASTTNYMSPTPFANQAAMAARALGQRGWPLVSATGTLPGGRLLSCCLHIIEFKRIGRGDWI